MNGDLKIGLGLGFRYRLLDFDGLLMNGTIPFSSRVFFLDTVGAVKRYLGPFVSQPNTSRGSHEI
jgi:hypothetical protein